MPIGFFNQVDSPYTSSRGGRHAGRANVIVQTTTELAIPLKIAAKLTQTGISLYTVFRADVHTSERLLHLMMAGVTAAEFGLSIALLYGSGDCEGVTSNLCTTINLLSYIYTGTLGLSQTIAEASKEPKLNAIQNAV
jgi:hypothetical protein